MVTRAFDGARTHDSDVSVLTPLRHATPELLYNKNIYQMNLLCMPAFGKLIGIFSWTMRFDIRLFK